MQPSAGNFFPEPFVDLEMPSAQIQPTAEAFVSNNMEVLDATEPVNKDPEPKPKRRTHAACESCKVSLHNPSEENAFLRQ